MSLWQNWINGFTGRRPKPEEPERAELDAQQSQIASRLSRMLGTERDEVFAEAYRQADEAVAERRRGERRKAERRKS